MRGLFIVCEGGDGVGKSTQVARLAEWLSGQGRDVVVTFEPGDSLVGQRIRELVLNPATGEIAPRAGAQLFTADKAHHVYEVVEPALARGADVVWDRYVDSVLAYQGAGRVLDVDAVEAIARWATQNLMPDLTVVLDVDPAQAVSTKRDKDRLEGEEHDFHERVRQGFLRLATRDPERYLVLPARDTREQVELAVRDRVQALLPAGDDVSAQAEGMSP